MAGVYKQKGKSDWYALWKVGRKNVRKSTHIPIKQEGKSERQTRKEALEVANRFEAVAKGDCSLEKQIDVLRAMHTANGKAARVPSVVEYLNGFVTKGGARNKSNSNRAFKEFLWWLGVDATKRLDRVTQDECQDFIYKQTERVTASTITRYKTSLSAAFNAAVGSEILLKNPWKGTKVPRDKGMAKNEREAFTVSEVRLMLEKLPVEWQDMVLVSLGTGAQRVRDCACLKWEAVDFVAGVIRMETAKTGIIIENPLVEPLAERLRKRWEERDETSPYVFPVMERRYHRSNGVLSTEFITLLKGLGIAGKMAGSTEGDRRMYSTKSFHGLRRFLVTEMRDSGASADLSRAIVGHESEAIERTYYRASLERKEKVLNAVMNGLCVPTNSSDGAASA